MMIIGDFEIKEVPIKKDQVFLLSRIKNRRVFKSFKYFMFKNFDDIFKIISINGIFGTYLSFESVLYPEHLLYIGGDRLKFVDDKFINYSVFKDETLYKRLNIRFIEMPTYRKTNYFNR